MSEESQPQAEKPQRDQLFAALAMAQAEMQTAKKAINNTFFKSKYADYAAVWEAVRGPLTKNGLSYMLLPTGGPDVYTFTAILAHKSGQSLHTTITVAPVDRKIQSYGSLVTYVKRYMLTSLTGVAVEDEDDDGNVASGNRVDTPDAAKAKADEIVAQRQRAQPTQQPVKEIKNVAPKAVQPSHRPPAPWEK